MHLPLLYETSHRISPGRGRSTHLSTPSKCADTTGCTHFTWTTYKSDTCWMKKGSTSKNNAVSTNDQSMVCGVKDGGVTEPVKPGATSSQVARKTTRYWDYCKPSCSWSGKVPGKNAYIKSCSKNGLSVHGNSDVKSGCDEGDAFPCNNQKPWAVNNKLAYGFAAASIETGKERCCSCYKLVFTSDPVQGKTMIVQMTNSRSDVSTNQFDLQIPGGGVGLFNGCRSQWNSLGEGWSQTYSGVASRQECNSLSSQIRDRCFFRFDWFKGADNPTVMYSKVRCPKKLVAITGCSA
jgi:hypothetical protein